jgi:hypothetical protein
MWAWRSIEIYWLAMSGAALSKASDLTKKNISGDNKKGKSKKK